MKRLFHEKMDNKSVINPNYLKINKNESFIIPKSKGLKSFIKMKDSKIINNLNNLIK